MLEQDLSVVEKLAKDDDNVADLLDRLRKIEYNKSNFIKVIIIPAIKKKNISAFTLGCFWNSCNRNLAIFAAFIHRVPNDIVLLIDINYMMHKSIPNNVHVILTRISDRIKQDFDESNINWKKYEV